MSDKTRETIPVCIDSDVNRLQQRIEHLFNETNYDNWDMEGAKALESEEWSAAYRFGIDCLDKGLPMPFISPCGDGSIHFCWHTKSYEVLIEKRLGEIILSTTRDERGLYSEQQVESDEESIRKVKEFLSRGACDA